jgi:hypothetical protein
LAKKTEVCARCKGELNEDYTEYELHSGKMAKLHKTCVPGSKKRPFEVQETLDFEEED